MATAKPGYVLIDFYCKKHEEKYGTKPTMNRFKRQWGFADMSVDLGLDGARSVIEYFFSINRRPPEIDELLRSYDRLAELQQAELQDKEHRKAVRERTRKMVQDWEDQHGQQL